MQLLTQLHSFSMGGPSHPHKSSLSPMSLQIMVDPTPTLSITLSLASVGPQSIIFQSLKSASWKHERQVLGWCPGFSGKSRKKFTPACIHNH
jgi:hypothetical protein